MKRFFQISTVLAILGFISAIVFGQGVVFFNTGTTMAVVDTNSTLLQAGNNGGGTGRVHYNLLENRGLTDIVFDFAATVTTTNLVINGITNTIYVGHLLRQLDAYELPAEKEYNGPIAAVSTNSGLQGHVALTISHNQN